MLIWNIFGNMTILFKILQIFFSDSGNTVEIVALYYLTDSVFEVLLYNRHAYIPHHLIAILLMYSIKNTDYCADTLQWYSVLFFFIEYTSLLLHIRSILKKNMSLNFYL